MKIAIIGSRNFSDWGLVASTLEPYLGKVTLVISGGAKGADFLGERWAKLNDIETLIFPADWDKFGKRAGYLRNTDIIKNCDLCIAFWDSVSRGTSHSISLCNKYNKPVEIIKI
jgi:hypothetical protein